MDYHVGQDRQRHMVLFQLKDAQPQILTVYGTQGQLVERMVSEIAKPKKDYFFYLRDGRYAEQGIFPLDDEQTESLDVLCVKLQTERRQK